MHKSLFRSKLRSFCLKVFSVATTGFLLFSCTSDTYDYSTITQQATLADYSKNQESSKELANKIKNARSQGLTIVHLGDSHTAADLLTGQTRRVLQQKLGTGALGYIEPMQVPGQGNALIAYSSKNVSLINSRSKHDYDYPFGGYIASFNAKGTVAYTARNNYQIPFSDLKIMARCTETSSCSLTISSDVGTSDLSIQSSNWAVYSVFVKGNFRLSANNNLEVAGLYLANNKGVSYSAIGSNGATIYHLNTWNNNWQEQLKLLKPDLIILSYGTNESFNEKLNAKAYSQDYAKLIAKLRNATDAQILIMSNPDYLNLGINRNLNNAYCNHQQATTVNLLHDTLRQVAQQNNTLFWDWRATMGGACSALTYIKDGRMRKDGVHFSLEAYKSFGTSLANDLLSLAK
ncbi:GDSL-type esterase/lipase family protein [Psittacicella hinzii]|uniref:Uncharacterized protein n=1 Tax=Psittacicella hinzii TaxID=2028575 RepID=A0A3A1YHQ9_9GAMM|nr:GDSL-type esterase/lipase family protein [Psittacicella hinzii]RIY36779.1 hypothetical protein CKF58_05695 [Psittacicella hinzii]